MIRFHAAVPASFLLLSISLTSAGQTFERNNTVADAPPSALQAPADSSVIVVRPELTTEQLADLYMVHKDYRQAAETYKRLTQENPRNPVYLNKLGIALHQQTALSLALKYYERATKVDPSYADAHNNIGTIWYQRKKYGKAIKCYQKALTLRKDMAVLYSNLGYAYFGDKKYEQSIASFHQALIIDPQFFEHNGGRTGSVLQDRSVTDRGRFYFMLAKSFAQSGNLERCIIYLRKAKDEGYSAIGTAKTDPDFAMVLKNPAMQEILAPKTADGARP
ncbi:MAG: tetratricopeptide repeat protein [Acidobacteriota bacterium]|nr:tetratricopeptide repeat protein [Acidobacteriota bacterium]